MKRTVFRIVALGIVLLLCTNAAAQTADDVSITTAEKLLKQLSFGSGFTGTLTLTAEAVEGREDKAFSTIMPLVLDLEFIIPAGGSALDKSRLTLSMDSSQYSMGSAEIALLDGNAYLRSTLMADGWYLLGNDILEPLLQNIGVQSTLPAVSGLNQTEGLLPGTLTFIYNMISYMYSKSTKDIDDAMQDYLAKIDFWLEGYRSEVQMANLDDGTSVMEILYRLPPAAVKAQLKQMIVDLMNDEALLNSFRTIMPEEQAAQYLNPELQPYYFYTADELPLDGDLTIHHVLSLLGDTLELSVAMPLYDSVSGAATIEYTTKQGGEDMPQENILSIRNETSYLEVNYHRYETMNSTQVYQGTILSQSAGENIAESPIYWASFDLSSQTQTTKDLLGYETQMDTYKLSVEPAAIPDGDDAARYAVFSKTNLALDMTFKSLAAKTSPTKADITLTVSGDDMPQAITLAISGETDAQWTPETIDVEQAVNLEKLPPEELQALLSQAVIKGGLLFLPYLNLPQLAPAEAN